MIGRSETEVVGGCQWSSPTHSGLIPQDDDVGGGRGGGGRGGGGDDEDHEHDYDDSYEYDYDK